MILFRHPTLHLGYDSASTHYSPNWLVLDHRGRYISITNFKRLQRDWKRFTRYLGMNSKALQVQYHVNTLSKFTFCAEVECNCYMTYNATPLPVLAMLYFVSYFLSEGVKVDCKAYRVGDTQYTIIIDIEGIDIRMIR